MLTDPTKAKMIETVNPYLRTLQLLMYPTPFGLSSSTFGEPVMSSALRAW